MRSIWTYLDAASLLAELVLCVKQQMKEGRLTTDQPWM